MKTTMLMLTAAMAATQVLAGVTKTKNAPVIDGRLDEACWREAEWNGGFKALSITEYKPLNQTEFAVITDGENLYLGAKLNSTQMDKVKSRVGEPIYGQNTAEFFFSPAADPQKYYQFVITAINGKRDANYGEEGGIIHPDPYAPEWKSAVTYGEDAWYVEAAIPLSAFYMTRAADWLGEWSVNMSRMDWSSPYNLHELSSWSELEKGFLEPSNFKRLNGFPKKTAADDVALTEASAKILREKDGKLEGELTVTVYAGAGGKFRFECEYAEAGEVELGAGITKFTRKCVFPGNRRYPVKLALVRSGDGKRFARTYPVAIDFDPLKIKFRRPGYRTNFYPGQDTSRIAGVITSAFDEPVKLVLEGPGIPLAEKTVKSGEAFEFATPTFAKGTATLTVTCGKEKRVKKIRNLEKSANTMTWVENGNLIVDGKPVFRRCMYGEQYRCSKPFLERFASEDFAITPKAQYVGLEPARLIAGSEQQYGIKDDPPPPEMFAAIDKAMDARKGQDFGGYYLADEPECRAISPVYLKYCYEHIIERDPYHVVFLCSRSADRYFDSCDVVEAHPYLCPYYARDGIRKYSSPLDRYGDHIAPSVALGRMDKVVGDIPFAFSYGGRDVVCDFATFDEYVASCWAVVCEGSKTLYPFIKCAIAERPAVYEGVKYTFTSVRALEDYLLFGDREILSKNYNHVATRWTMKDGRRMFAVVNFHEQTYRARFKAGRGVFREFRGGRTFRNVWGTDEIQIDLGPFETVVATTEPADAGLESLEDFRAKVRRLELERTSRDNQILGREAEIKITVGGRTQIMSSLMDGVLDQTAYVCNDVKKPLEFLFPREPVKFSRIRLYGDQPEKTVFEVFADGEWKTLKPKAEKTGPYSVEFDFGGVISAEKLRVAPQVWRSELYEIEIPY